MVALQINYVNIALMIGACVLAFVIPFELLLFSYAFLGPLHYLTEISWLHERNYFTKGKKDFILLIIFCFLIIFSVYFKVMLSWFLSADDKGHLIVSPSLKAFVDSIDNLVPAFVLLTFGAALIMIIAQRRTVKLFLYGVLLLLAWLLKEDKTWLVPFAAFLPTLIHVFLFTGMFILVGALKNRSFSGILSLFIFISCAASFFFIQPDAEGYIVNDTLRYSYNMSLVNLNYTVLTTFLPTQLGDLRTADQILNFIYASKPGLILSRFLAFAYTYHYLNWFSKTSIIKWHLVPRKQLMVVGLLWLISVCLFVYDYNVGYLALYLLSTLHVIMELPLNFHSFRQAGEQIALLLKPKSG